MIRAGPPELGQRVGGLREGHAGPRAALAPLVGQDLGVGQPGVVVDGGMHVVVAGPRPRTAVPVAAAVLGRVAAVGAVAAAWS
jgi:hypothetical protein